MVDDSFVGVCVLLLDVCNGTSNDVFWRKKNNLLVTLSLATRDLVDPFVYICL